MRSELTRAFAFAAEAHQGQVYGDDTPYIYHPVAVAQSAAQAGLSEQHQIVALLHDVLEDTQVSYWQLSLAFTDPVAEAVRHLSQKDGQARSDYREQVLRNDLARAVKPHDLRVNLLGLPDLAKTSPSRAEWLLGKYSDDLGFFLEAGVVDVGWVEEVLAPVASRLEVLGL